MRVAQAVYTAHAAHAVELAGSPVKARTAPFPFFQTSTPCPSRPSVSSSPACTTPAPPTTSVSTSPPPPSPPPSPSSCPASSCPASSCPASSPLVYLFESPSSRASGPRPRRCPPRPVAALYVVRERLAPGSAASLGDPLLPSGGASTPSPKGGAPPPPPPACRPREAETEAGRLLGRAEECFEACSELEEAAGREQPRAPRRRPAPPRPPLLASPSSSAPPAWKPDAASSSYSAPPYASAPPLPIPEQRGFESAAQALGEGSACPSPPRSTSRASRPPRFHAHVLLDAQKRGAGAIQVANSGPARAEAIRGRGV
eukprot:tig00000219_g19519.t1